MSFSKQIPTYDNLETVLQVEKTCIFLNSYKRYIYLDMSSLLFLGDRTSQLASWHLVLFAPSSKIFPEQLVQEYPMQNSQP